MTQLQSTPDRRRITLTVIGTLLGVLSVLVILGGLLYVGKPPALDPSADKVFNEKLAQLNSLRADDQNALGSYGWVDRPKGVVRIPIDQAMQKLVEESGSKGLKK